MQSPFHSHGAGPTGWGRGIYERPAAAHWCNLCVNRRSAQATETHVYPRRAFESICPFRHRDELFSPLSHIALERGPLSLLWGVGRRVTCEGTLWGDCFAFGLSDSCSVIGSVGGHVKPALYVFNFADTFSHDGDASTRGRVGTHRVTTTARHTPHDTAPRVAARPPAPRCDLRAACGVAVGAGELRNPPSVTHSALASHVC